MSFSAPLPYYAGQPVTRQNINNFIPNVWTGDIRRYRDRKFHLAMVTKTYDFVGQKGDTLKIPLFGRAAVYDRMPGNPVRLQVQNGGQYEVKVDKDRESSFGMDNIVNIQSQYELRQIYTREAGYAQARDLDNALLGLRAAIPTTQQIFRTTGAGAGTISGDPAPLDNAVILAAMQQIMESDVPLEECRWVMSPNQAFDLVDIDKFISNDYNLATVRNGILGTLYGLPVHVTTQITNNTLNGYINGEGATPEPTPGVAGSPYLPTQEAVVGSGLPRGKSGSEVAQPFQTAMLVHPEWALMLKQRNLTVEQSRETLYQMDVLVTNQVYGCKTYRQDHCVMIHSRGT